MLCWNVIYGNFNTGEIETMNVFDHYSFYKDCVKAKKKYRDNKAGFADEVKFFLKYYFWSKCEWEVIVDHWPSSELYAMRRGTTMGELREKFGYDGVCAYIPADRKVEVRVFPVDSTKRDLKIDVYDQVMNNWDIFIDYLWANRKELKERK